MINKLKAYYHFLTFENNHHSYILSAIEAFKRRKYGKKDHIMISAFPKSGSTFLSRTIENLMSYEGVSLNYPSYFDHTDTEESLSLPRIVDYLHFNTVSHQHIRASKDVILLLQKYNIKPIILVRNIYDVLVSLKDHFHNESPVRPFLYSDETFLSKPEEEQIDMLVELAVPWYINFYVSWVKAKESLGKVYFLNYETLMSSKAEEITKILNYFEYDKNVQEISSSIEQIDGKSRKNVGIRGRGVQLLTESQKNKIIQMTRFYPEIDFSLMGIPNN